VTYFASEEEAQEWDDYFSNTHEAPIPEQYLQVMDKKSSHSSALKNGKAAQGLVKSAEK
jgi:hypothetical protein